MFNKSKSTLVLATTMLIIGNIGAAQDLSTSMSDWYNGVVAQQSAQQNAAVGQIVQQNMQDPQIQALYQQHLASGGGGSFEEFAYAYAATGGFTPQGYAAYGQTSSTIAAQQSGTMEDYWAAQDANADAMGAYSSGYIANSQEMGNVIAGNQTYYGSDGSAVLPYGWQPDSYNTYNGQSYYVDQSGQYFQVDPNNSGWMYPINPGW